MKLNCQQQDLSKALNIVSKAISNKTTIPILKGVLLDASSDNILNITASDMDITIKKPIAADVSEKGAIVVSAKLFLDIIKKLPPGEIEIHCVNEQVTIKSSSSLFSIVGQNPDEFPEIGEFDKNNIIKLDRVILREMIRKTAFAASIEEAKGIIVGVLIEIIDSKMSMVALDGFRMAVTRRKVYDIDDLSLVIAARILNEVNKIFTEEESIDEVSVILDDKKAIFLLDETTIILRIMEGSFIQYKDILPKEHKSRIIVNRSEMIDCLDRASLLAREGRNNLIKFTIMGNLITISSQSEEGNVKEEIHVENDGDDLEIGFNVKYLIEVFKAINDDDVVMEFNTNVSPCLIKPTEGDEFEYLILPVRIATRVF